MYLTGEKKLSARSVNRKISSVKSFYRFLRKRKIGRQRLVRPHYGAENAEQATFLRRGKPDE